MDVPFSEVVVALQWRRRAEDWIERQVVAADLHLIGIIEQVHVRPWSTVLAVPTSAGRWWFKASAPSTRAEPGLHRLVAGVAPELVSAPIAVDEARGWMLTRGHGNSVAVAGPALGPAQWSQLLGDVARAQLRLASERDAVIATGVNDCSPSTVPDRFDRLVTIFSALPPGHPSHIEADLAHRLADARRGVVEAAELLAASGVPTTWQHGDLHPGNVARESGGDESGVLRVFDLGDGQWAHAAETLSVPYGWIRRYDAGIDWESVVTGWSQVWDLDSRETAGLAQAARVTVRVNRAAHWHAILAGATTEEISRWGAEPVRQLSTLVP